MPQATTERKRIERGVCARCGKRPPKPGGQRCETCLKYLRGRSEAWRRRHGSDPWRAGGPGRAPKGATRMEPQCKPTDGRPMRPEHDFDPEVGRCAWCGAKRETATPPAATPRPAPRPIVAAPAAEGLRRSPGGRSKPTAEGRRAFGQMAGGGDPRRKPVASAAIEVLTGAPDPELIEPVLAPDFGADFASTPDPIAATIAALELERDEIDITITTLRRMQDRKAASA